MKNIKMDRRNFLKYTAAVTAGTSLFNYSAVAADNKTSKTLLKAVKIGMLPGDLSDEEKFKIAKKCGFDGIDGVPLDSLDAAREQADLARAAGGHGHLRR